MGLLQSRHAQTDLTEEDASPWSDRTTRQPTEARADGEGDYRDFRPRPPPRRRRASESSDDYASYVPSRRRTSGGHPDGGAGGDGTRVYDNLVVGDPSNVVFGRGNRAGRRLGGRVSGNRVMR